MADEKNADAASKLEGYRQDFYLDFAATEEQRDKSNEELRFVMVSGGQWEGFLEASFENRAKLELDQTADYLYRTYSQWTEGRIGVNYLPDDDTATDDDAELLEGLFRRDLRRRNGQSAIDSAVFEAMAAGCGAIHMSTEYEDDEDPDNKDQCVVFSELSNAYATVAWDAAARRKDKADAQRCTVLIPHSPDGFKRKYPDAKPNGALQPQDRRWFNWSSPQIVYEAIRYEVRVEVVTVYNYGHPESEDIVQLTAQELKDDGDELKAAGYIELSKKQVKRRNIYRTKFCGDSVPLEAERRIAGKYIPVIPFFGYFAHIDGVDYWHGVVRKRIDSQRLLNMSASLMAEGAASATEDKLIFAPEQMQSVKTGWAQNRHSKPYMLAEPIRNPDGTVAVAGPVGKVDGATQSVAAQTLLETVRQLIQQGTGGAPQDTIDPDTSGKAINAVLKRVDMNAQPIFDNIKAAIQHCGVVYRHIAAEIYAERTRTVNIVTPEGEMQRKQLLQMSAKDGQISYSNDPSKGRFEAIADAGPSYQSQRESTIEALKDIVKAIPPEDPLGRIVLSRIIEMLPAQGMDDIKAYIRKQMLLQGVRQPETPEDMQILQQAAQSSGQPDPQAELFTAAAQNQRMQAAERVAKIKDLGASAEAKHAGAVLDMAKTRVTLLGIHQPEAPAIPAAPAAPARPRLRLVSAQ